MGGGGFQWSEANLLPELLRLLLIGFVTRLVCFYFILFFNEGRGL